MPRSPVYLMLGLLAAAAPLAAAGDRSEARSTAIRAVEAREKTLRAINRDLWNWAEIGLQEVRSSARLAAELESAGFRVKRGVSGMPTSFVAEYGSGRPVIALLAEYDALPELSQDTTGERRPLQPGGNGHGCGHCAFGTAVVGGALSAREAMERHRIPGTLRVYGTPAEETVIGKVYMVLDGQFDDVDTVLHWHPGARNKVNFGSTKAMISAKFAFTGTAAHAAGSPDKGRSALDGVELMNIGVNYMREHVKETARLHYVITNGGGQPNVVPPSAEVWYYIRANNHEDAVMQFDWIRDIAEAAAKMSRTRVAVRVDTDCHEIIPNEPLSKMLQRNLEKVGPPRFSEADRSLATAIQQSLKDLPGFKETEPLHTKIEKLPSKPTDPEGGSTDVGDVSWKVPTGGFSAACFALGSPGHSWQNVAAVGSPIGEEGMLTAARVLALSALDLLTDEELRRAAREDWERRMKDKPYVTRIPKGQKAPASIR